jgi:hypothetical protein
MASRRSEPSAFAPAETSSKIEPASIGLIHCSPLDGDVR